MQRRDTETKTQKKKTQVPRRPAHDLRRADGPHLVVYRSLVRLDHQVGRALPTDVRVVRLLDGAVRSRRPAVLRRIHAIDARRLQERRSWVLSFPILRPFGPSRGPRCSTQVSSCPSVVQRFWIDKVLHALHGGRLQRIVSVQFCVRRVFSGTKGHRHKPRVVQRGCGCSISCERGGWHVSGLPSLRGSTENPILHGSSSLSTRGLWPSCYYSVCLVAVLATLGAQARLLEAINFGSAAREALFVGGHGYTTYKVPVVSIHTRGVSSDIVLPRPEYYS